MLVKEHHFHANNKQLFVMYPLPSGIQERIHDRLKCVEIYFREFDLGTIYGLKLKYKTRPAHLMKQLKLMYKYTDYSEMDDDMLSLRGISRWDEFQKNILPPLNAKYGDMFGIMFPAKNGHVPPELKIWKPNGGIKVKKKRPIISVSHKPAAKFPGRGVEETPTIQHRVRERGHDDGAPEFDVVKKRRVIESAPIEPDEDNSAVALAAFEDFESSVLPALESIRADEEEFRRDGWLHDMECSIKGEVQETEGGVYFAWSACLKCMKIGATRRKDPLIRLRELSRYVPMPFTLTAFLPSSMPFRTEAHAHAFFASRRIRNPGAGTEFFNIGEKEVEEFVGKWR